MPTKSPRPARKPKLPPVPAEYRAQCHATLDHVLDNGGITAIMIVWEERGGVDAVSVPPSLSTKQGMAIRLYLSAKPEGVEIAQ